MLGLGQRRQSRNRSGIRACGILLDFARQQLVQPVASMSDRSGAAETTSNGVRAF